MKYWSIFKTSIAQEFAYRLNFLFWRVRNIIQILIFFFLWDAVFLGKNTQIFGYNKPQIFTYAFVLIVVRALVFSIRSNDVAGQIANGELSNMLLKPVNYFKYWLTRDLVYKFLNLFFGTFEATILIIILKPNIYIQTNPVYLFGFAVSLLIAIFLYFIISMTTSFAPFWVPEVSWGAQFLVMIVISEFLSGASFPLDIFPGVVYKILMLTPFPYLIFAPIKIYLGSFGYSMMIQSIVVGLVWCLLLWKMSLSIWRKGLKIYEGVGR